MKFVIEFDDFTCGATKRKVVCRGWERERRGAVSSACHQSLSWAGGSRAAPKPNRSNKTPERANDYSQMKGKCDTTTGRRNATQYFGKFLGEGNGTLTLDVQVKGGWAMRILRDAHCPRTVLRVYAQHLSAGRSGLTFLGGGHGW